MGKRGDWCILRTSGPHTLPLARSLVEHRYDAWTPIRVEERRRPRSQARRRVEMPILPTFVFVRAAQVEAIAAAMAAPLSPHPPGSVMRYYGRVPEIADSEVRGLRAEEDRLRRRALQSTRHHVPEGTALNFVSGPFGGLSGVVEGCDGKFAEVRLVGGLSVKVASWRILDGEVQVAA